jgi:hypothetical protein
LYVLRRHFARIRRSPIFTVALFDVHPHVLDPETAVIVNSGGEPQVIDCVTLRNGTMHVEELPDSPFMEFRPPGTTTTVLSERPL